MLTVYKYPAEVDDNFRIEMPANAKILKVQAQYGSLCILALVNPVLQTETREFRLARTGHPIDCESDDLSYIGTFQLAHSQLVLHLFEVLKIGRESDQTSTWIRVER